MRFVGDIVAAVVAETQAQAVDAAETVVVDYDPLPVGDDGGRRRSPPTRRCCSPSTARTCASAPTFGEDDVDPLEGADAVAEVTMVSQRLAGVPMETNGILAVPERRRAHAAGSRTRRRTRSTPRTPPMLGLEPEKLRVVCPWVGGGFGPKAAVYVEHLVAGGGGADARRAR